MIEGEGLQARAPVAPPSAALERLPLLEPIEPRSFMPPGRGGGRAEGCDPPIVIGGPLAALGIAAFVCDSLAMVRAMTPVAVSALAVGRVRLVDGRLRAPQHYDASEMETAISAAACRDLSATQGETVVNRNRREPAAVQVVDVISLPRSPDPSGFEPRAIVVLRGGELSWQGLEPVLTRAFGLTAAEAQVAARMALGAPREQIAAERGASLQTVRSQIKSIFNKLNVTRERELMSVLAKLAQR